MSQLNYVELMRNLIRKDAQHKERLRDEPDRLQEITSIISQNARLLSLCEENEKIKVAHFFCQQDRQETYIPLNAFIFNYSILLQNSDDLEIYNQIKDEATQNCHIIYCSLKTPQCKIYFCIGTARNSHLTLMNYRYSDGVIRPTLHCITDRGSDHMITPPFTFNISQIIPQTCKHCGIYQENIKKCKGCWENLRIRVNYCSKECQKIDFNLGRHKDVCGCRSKRAVDRRLREIVALGLDPESAFRS
jgi:hypothetical protein